MEPVKNATQTTCEDELLTNLTGFLGMKTRKVGFKAPGLVYYSVDYTEVTSATILHFSSEYHFVAV